MQEFDHLKVHMQEIISATGNFSQNNRIGGGGFGPVYKGELSLPTGSIMVAFKRLDPRLGQGNTEFWKEIMMLSKCKHKNLVSLLHFCNEGVERVLVYEYASRGSLDRYLGDASLTWNQRLHICIGAARALRYLHDPLDTHQRVIHRDMKSANILLDENWVAKVSDFGLSKFGPANQPQTYMITNAAGTQGYCDPLYADSGILSKESDVYSFGVVLFEVMCGRLCCEYRNGELAGILVRNWKKCYDENKLDEIIFQDLKRQIVGESLITFSAVAYRCLNRDRRDQRPLMDEIVKELEFALAQQENIGRSGVTNLVTIAKIAVPPLIYRSKTELSSLLQKGVLVDERKRWIWINNNEQIHEMVSATHCFDGKAWERVNYSKSRFKDVLLCKVDAHFEVNVSTQFLSPDRAYTVNLVFNIMGNEDPEQAYYWEYFTCWAHVPFKYKLDEATADYRYSSNPSVREDGWLTVQLYQYTNKNKNHRFRLEFTAPTDTRIYKYILEGIELHPVN